MEEKIYKCVCGKEFTKPNSFNGHKSNCKVHQISKHGSLDFYKESRKKPAEKISKSLKQRSEEKRAAMLAQWIDEQHTCEKCGKILVVKYGSGRFCSVSCANSNTHKPETKRKIGDGIKATAKILSEQRYTENVHMYEKSPKYCVVCGEVLPYDKRNSKTCGNSVCVKTRLHDAGVKSIQIQGDTRRSKNEMLFASKCIELFDNVETNAPMFQGWDADVILHDQRIAILWNGPWHFIKLTKQHSVTQVQSRDKLKIQAIKECGYTPYVIEDKGAFNEAFVEDKFQDLLKFIKTVHT